MGAVPQLGFLDRSIFTATAGGTGKFTFAAPVLGFQSPLAAAAVDQQQYGYAAQSVDLTQWEYGYGTWSSGPQTLTRTVLGNHLNTTSPVNFTAPPNVLITLLAESVAQIAAGANPLATGNLTFFVATTGSDSNPGTALLPFATLQHAANVAAGFDYQALYHPTINIGAGTFTITLPVILPELLNLPQGTSGLIIGQGYTITTMFDSPGNGGIVAQGWFSIWSTASLTVDSDNFCFTSVSGATLGFSGSATGPTTTQIGLADSSGFGNVTCLQADNNGHIGGAGVTFNILTSTLFAFFENFYATNSGPGGQISFISSTVVFQANSADFAFIRSRQGSLSFSYKFRVMTYTNAGTLTGAQAKLAGSGGVIFVVTDNGLFSDLPGTSAGNTFDNSVYISAASTVPAGWTAVQFAGILTASQLAASTYAVFKDTSGGGVYIAYNDAGTIKKVALT